MFNFFVIDMKQYSSTFALENKKQLLIFKIL